MSKQPLISIILPVYNSSAHLKQALNSILNQSYSNWELIAINDASTDHSQNILKSYAQKSPKIKIFSHTTNQGIARSLNKALKHAQGQYIARMDSDDIMLPNRLQKQLKYLLKHPQTIVVGGQCQLIDTQDKLIGKKTFPTNHQQIYQLAFIRSPLQHPAIMINTALLPKNFSWYHTDQVPAEDLDLYFRLFQYGKAANLSDTVIKYRQNPQGLSLKDPLHTYLTAYKIRQNARKQYNYQPTFSTKIINKLISLAILVFPKNTIYPLYSLISGFTFPHIKLPNLKTNLQLAKQG